MMRHRILPLLLLWLTALPALPAQAAGPCTVDAGNLQRHTFEGYGVSLCWWANACGQWPDEKIDQLIDWLISPANLNYRIFRYNIGGGDDPLWRHCTPHHNARGKGLRAEMPGFRDSADAPYNWGADGAQRKVMLKIRARRPDAIFEAFSNSCPYYMTYSGCCAGNVNPNDDNLRPECYTDFAHYLVDVCCFYRDSFNLVFRTLEPFNEPITDFWYASGSQEGCHFSLPAQIKFLKVLTPILKASGLQTAIAASDETNVDRSLRDLKGYVADGEALSQIAQWNTHTYSGSQQARTDLGNLAERCGKRLWMSETGSGGRGIEGNLSLAQRMITDIRLLQPQAWIDWQYVEEYGDQWSFVTGNFRHQNYHKVKNYYVRYQFSHYILPGSTFLRTTKKNMLASLSAGGDSLVIVVLNNSDAPASETLAIEHFDANPNLASATYTSPQADAAPFDDYRFSKGTLAATLPPRSVATFVLKK
jgi:O-glycosyl hydrolase